MTTLRTLLAWSLCIVCLGWGGRAVAADDDLLGFWKFDAGQGDVAADSSGHENDGEIWDAEWVRGPFGTALRFDGRGAHVSVPEIAGLDGSDELTVEAWVLWEGTGRYPNILTGGTWSPGGFLLFVRDDQCSFRMGRPGFSASGEPKKWSEVGVPLVSPFSENKWYHLAAVFKRPEIKTYVNGRQVGSARWDYAIGYRGDLVIGKWAGAVSHKGLIDEAKVYRRALRPEEIAADYQQQSAGRSAAPEGTKPYETIPRQSQLAAAVASFDNRFATLAVGPTGRVTALVDKRTGRDHVLRTAPLVSITQGGTVHRRAECSLEDGKLVFRFAKAGATVVLDVEAKPGYFVFRVDSVSGENIDAVTFVDLNLKECTRVDAMSGLAADDEFGVCLRTLNLPTYVRVGGNPPALVASSSKSHGLAKGAAALAACPTEQMLPVLQDLVRNEGLPWSPQGGPFSLDAEGNRGSYVFARVGEKDVDAWIDLARRGGIATVHLSGWQESLGHYEPSGSLYPNGREGLKEVVRKLHEAGLKVGIHTLTGCISTNDPWVRPVPDARLAIDGTYTLAADLGKTDADVPTAEPPDDWPTVWAYGSRGNCIRIDDELIQYSALAGDSPRGFFKCHRGAFGTTPAAHQKGAPVRHMFVRYGCFVPDEESTLVDDVAERIADVYNGCELDQIYMDGAEAMRGWYGIARMRQAIFTRLTRPALVEASCWDHHSWPFHSRIGAWDHPKWGLKRFADDHLKAVEQYRRGALLEAQLGWWVILGPDRDWNMEMPDEIEYLSAKALAWDAPLSFQNVTATGRPSNARQDEYLTTIGRYERLRLANYFDDATCRRLRTQRQEFRLVQADDGRWRLVPTDYLGHKVTGLDDGTSTWTVANRYAAQPLRLRIEALYSAFPYDDSESMTLVDSSADGQFTPAGAASGVQCKVQTQSPNDSLAPSCPAGSLRFAATNSGDSPVGAWARAVKTFDPVADMTPYDAIGVWVRGDGKGEVVNFQLTNLPEYFRTLDDHYVKVDFQGWRYFELLLRERDAAAYHDYKWPYGAHCVLHRSPLVRQAVNKLTLYLNNLPPGEEAACSIGPIKALKTRKTTLRNPAVEIGGRRLVFPVELESGMYIDLESPDDCRLYDERGNLVEWLKPQGEVPQLAPGDNRIAFTCQGTEGFRSRAEVTVVTGGEPFGGRRPDDQIDWSLLDRQYELPRTIFALDGRQNRWQIACRPKTKDARLAIELAVDEVGGKMAAYEAPSAVTLEGFEEPAAADAGAAFAYDQQPTASGCNEGVTQQLVCSDEAVKLGKSTGRYTATSSCTDNGGWSVKGRQLAKPLDLTGFASIGFWLHGDGGGELFKLQLRDAAGGWQDMYTRVDFTGWRYCQFPLGSSTLKDPTKVLAMNIYYNAIPAGKTVTCFVDEIRLLHEPEPLRDPTFVVAGRPVRFPVAVGEGDRLVFRRLDDCRLYRRSGEVENVTPEGTPPRLAPGRNPIEFSLPESSPGRFRVVVSLETVYP